MAEVERRLSVIEELEAVVSANLQRAVRLRQATLQRAFSGGSWSGRKIDAKTLSLLQPLIKASVEFYDTVEEQKLLKYPTGGRNQRFGARWHRGSHRGVF